MHRLLAYTFLGVYDIRDSEKKMWILLPAKLIILEILYVFHSSLGTIGMGSRLFLLIFYFLKMSMLLI